MHTPSSRSAETVVAVTGALTVSTIEAWGRVLTEAIASRPARLIVDLSACPPVRLFDRRQLGDSDPVASAPSDDALWRTPAAA